MFCFGDSQLCCSSKNFLPLRCLGWFACLDGSGGWNLLGAKGKARREGAQWSCDKVATNTVRNASFLNSLLICLAKQVMETENNNLLQSSGHECPFPLGNERLHGHRMHHWVMTTFQNKVSISYVTM